MTWIKLPRLEMHSGKTKVMTNAEVGIESKHIEKVKYYLVPIFGTVSDH